MESQLSHELRELQLLVEAQRGQISSLVKQHKEFRVQSEVLCECLELAGVLPAQKYLAAVHRLQFSRTLQEHPCTLHLSLGMLQQTRELAIGIAQSAGFEAMVHLSVTSRVGRRTVNMVMSERPALFPPLIHIIGGSGHEGAALAVERFAPHSGAWELPITMPHPQAVAAAAVAEGKIYVLGGGADSLHTFVPASQVWEPISAPKVVRWGTAAAAARGKVYAIGGFSDGKALQMVERYDPKMGSWEQLPPMCCARGALTAAEVSNMIYAVGGENLEGSMATVERFSPELNAWELLSPMCTPRASATAVGLRDQLFVMGGYANQNQDLRSVERLEPNTGTWELMAPMSIPRYGAGAASIDGVIYIFGGRNDNDGTLDVCERYDLARDAWVQLPRMPTARGWCAVVAVRS